MHYGNIRVIRTRRMLCLPAVSTAIFFFNGSMVTCRPDVLEPLARLAVFKAGLRHKSITTVVGAERGGIEVAYEIARQIGARSISLAKDGAGGFELKRGEFGHHEKILFVEDVVTTGGTFLKLEETLRELQGGKCWVFTPTVIALCNRSGTNMIRGYTLQGLFNYSEAHVWKSDECPLCKQGSVALKPKENWEKFLQRAA